MDIFSILPCRNPSRPSTRNLVADIVLLYSLPHASSGEVSFFGPCPRCRVDSTPSSSRSTSHPSTLGWPQVARPAYCSHRRSAGC
eukprot:14759150-Heterocapsa_arctica.AAC.1